MGKKRNHPSLEEVLQRPWCYYCERDFDDLKILINHQKAKHFKCDRCNRRLNTAGGLSVHMTQVHKESLDAIENALPNRVGLEVEIFGMEGIPEDVIQSHNQRVIAQYSQAEADRRASGGGGGPGSSGANPSKKPKFEAPSDLKKRLAEHKAKKAAEEAAVSTAATTPMDTMGAPAPGFAQPPGFSGSPPGFGQPFSAPPAPGVNNFPQPFGQPPAAFQPPPGYGTPPGPPFGQQQQFPPPQPFQSPNSAYAPPSQYQTGPQPQAGPPRAFGANSPSVPFQVSPPPPQNGAQAPRPSNLPPAPGLPQRPSFGAPPISSFQMQQMHHGQMPGPPAMPIGEGQSAFTNGAQGHAPQGGDVTLQAPVPANGSFGNQQHVPTAGQEAKVADGASEKKSKKDKDKEVRMVYADNEVSPEEKMAKLPRYAFDPKEREETVLGDVTAAVTGTVSGPEDAARDGNRGIGKDN